MGRPALLFVGGTAAPGNVRPLLPSTGQGRSAGPEVGRGVPTPPSLPLDSTHSTTGPGLLALDKPKEVGSTGKNWRFTPDWREDLLTIFFGSADWWPLSRCATAPLGGAVGMAVNFAALPRALPLGELANPQDLTERARLSEKGRRRPGENPPVKMLPQAVRRLSGTTKLK